MAAIDKTYGTLKQYNQLYDWCKNNRPYLLRFVTQKNYFKKDMQYSEAPDDNILAIFPIRIDLWLLENCPLKWLHQKIKTAYNCKGKSNYFTIKFIKNRNK